MTATNTSSEFDGEKYRLLLAKLQAKPPLETLAELVDLIVADLERGEIPQSLRTLEQLKVLLLMNSVLFQNLIKSGDDSLRQLVAARKRLAEVENVFPSSDMKESVH